MNKINRGFLIIVFILVSGISAYPKETLTLDNCIATALTNNHYLQVTREKLRLAKGRKKEAAGNFLPVISLSAAYTKMSDAPGITMFSPQYTYVSVPDSLSGRQVTGGLVTGAQQQTFSLSQLDNYLGKISLAQPIFTWGRISQAYRQASLGCDAIQQELAQAESEITLNVKKSFLAFLLARENLKISEEAVAVMRKHYDVTNSFYREGKVSRIDVSRVKVQLVNSKTGYIKARNALELSRKTLFNLINAGNSDYEIQGELKYSPRKFDLAGLTGTALANRPEIKMAKLQHETAESFLKTAGAQNRPNLSLAANYQYQKPYYFTNEWVANWNAALVLNYQLFDGFSSAGRVEQAKAQISQVEISQDNLKKDIKLEVEKAYLKLTESEERITEQEANVRSAKDNLSAIQNRFELGLSSDLDLRDTQLALTEAETEYSQALFDYNISLAGLEKSIGR